MQNDRIIETLSSEFNIKARNVSSTIELIDDGSTIPFLSRYRKELTGGMDDEALYQFSRRLEELRAIDKRRESIVNSLSEQGVLTPQLESHLAEARTMTELEDIYLPFKPRRRSRATVARERGLEPLAKIIMAGREHSIEKSAQRFVKGEISNIDEAIAGASDIIAEWMSEHAATRRSIRDLYSRTARITVTIDDKSGKAALYRSLDKFATNVSRIPSHRLLAALRAEREGAAGVKLEVDRDHVMERMARFWIKSNFNTETTGLVNKIMRDAFTRLLKPSIENEIMSAVKERADREAISVFAGNLHSLLLQPPLGQRSVLAIDPGFKQGCKLACINPLGVPVDFSIIFPTTTRNNASGAESTILTHVKRHKITDIAVGNGTGSHETVAFLRSIDWGDIKAPNIHVVNEAGASVYSASEYGRREFPDLDPLARGAISIGRRLQDPLAELIKIEPSSIGVGQYQHDVDQQQLKSTLDMTVQSCVNAVGVDINSASARLLEYVAGVGPKLAHAIVDYRSNNGSYTTRNEILKVPRLGPKAFQQAAGFLRINGGSDPLDATGVHPESYPVVRKMARDHNVSVKQLIGNPSLLDSIVLENYITEKAGLPTLRDIIEALKTPGRDPRGELRNATADNQLSDISQLRPGMKLDGVVNNVTDFGAFVDLGVHVNALLHISAIKRHGARISLSQRIEVIVIDVDIDRKRISIDLA